MSALELTDEQVERALMELRVTLYAAAQRLKGARLEEFKQLITEIGQVLDIAPTVVNAPAEAYNPDAHL